MGHDHVNVSENFCQYNYSWISAKEKFHEHKRHVTGGGAKVVEDLTPSEDLLLSHFQGNPEFQGLDGGGK